MDRRTARETAFVMLFEREFKPDEPAGDILSLAREIREIEENEFTDRLYYGVVDKIDVIDEVIKSHSVGWKTKRLSKVTISILRLAIYEMMFMEDVPLKVSINEAVELAKKYEGEKTPGFINGILNASADDLGLKNDDAK